MDINVLNPQGELVSIPKEQLSSAINAGYQKASSEDVSQYSKKQKYETTGQELATGLEGAASAATFGLSTGLERALGVKPEDIQGRREINPGIHALGQIGGLAATAAIPGLGEAEIAAEAGAKAINPLSASSVMGGLGEKAAAQMGLGEGIASQAASGAVNMATQNAIFQAGDETSKWLSGDPNQTIETAAANVGLAALIGGGVGAPLGAVSPLWEAASGSKIGQYLEDFKGRIKEHIDNPNPVSAVSDELKDFHSGIKSVADEVYGTQGLKARGIQNAMPEMSDTIAEQTGQLSGKINGTVENMRKNPDLFPGRLVSKLENSFNQFNDQIAGSQDPSQVFDALNDMKQMAQSFAKFDKRVPSTDESYDFIQSMKSLSHDIRNSLEDKSVWGRAAEVQQKVNQAFVDYLPKLKNFESRFTAEVNGERVIDPGKINTYVNQLGKPNAEIKQEVLKNFLDSSQKYKQVIDKIYSDIGAESPFQTGGLHHSHNTLDAITPGAKLADAIIRRGLSRLAGEGIGAGVGTGIGAMVGHPFIGALIGEHALGPFFNSILPSLVKPLLEKEASAAGMKSAVDVASKAIKGESILNKSAKAIFQGGAAVLPQPFQISDKHLDRLDDRLKALQENPNGLMNMGGRLGHYAPDHAISMGQTAANGVNVLNSLRPNPSKQNPLDSDPVVSVAEKNAYRTALEIAQNPIGLLSKVKDGTINVKEVQLMKKLYPSLYAKTGQKLIYEMTEHLSKDGKIPYKTKIGLSIFLGQPLDSTMTPIGIQSRQVANKTNLAPSQQETAMKPKSSALNKLADSSMTSGQRAESKRLK